MSSRATLPLDAARGVGVLLVLYSYVVALRPDELDEEFRLVSFVRKWVNQPLGIGEDFGFLGLALLLVTSGYQVSEAAIHGTRLVIGRLFVVYPPFLLAVTVAAVLTQVESSLLSQPRDIDVGVSDWLANIGFLAHLHISPVLLLELTWIALVEMLFVLCTAAISHLLRSLTWLAILVQLALVAAVVATAREASGLYREVGLLVVFLVIPLIGQLIWSVHYTRVPRWAGALLCGASWATLAWAEREYQELNGWWYALATLYAVVGFALAIRWSAGRISPRPMIWLADRAYGLVFLQGAVGWLAFDFLHPHLPLSVVAVLALAATFSAAEISYRFVERPAPFLARRLAKQYRGTQNARGDNPLNEGMVRS
ncbi:hypothetical protein GCM10012275_30930 [Longimycelium tulufanense]|uniref:Acyltransferase n=2 Tax=Longimycelium tulufanense TaxID=907463 RepID=A0A8J3CFE3_9PSEU|nr:hypothetical protein GCM10012275_30930 [Longimycelium tulufanense]